MVPDEGLYGSTGGEIHILNFANLTETDRTGTGVTPIAGMTINVVVHVVHDTGTGGKLKVWFNGVVVYDKSSIGTVYTTDPFGGNHKIGVYKYGWRNVTGTDSDTSSSSAVGVDLVRTSIGQLKIKTNFTGDPDYGVDAYNEVTP
jgi:hypothetical protein